jgi:DNA transformation protein
MAADSAFVGFVVECLQPMGAVGARRMFGGHGIFLEGLMFGLVADGQLYLKVDDCNRAAYETEGLQPFTYSSRGRTIELPYRQAPGEAFDDPEVMCAWGREAFAAALRAARKTRRRSG